MSNSHGAMIQYDSIALSKIKFTTRDFVSTIASDSFPEEKTTWLNFYVLDDFEPIEAFCRKESIDLLVTQIIREGDSRPQFEDYEKYLFFSIRAAIPSGSMKIQQEQLAFLLGPNYLISFQSKPSDYFGTVRNRLETKQGILRDKGPDFLLYRLLDAITDKYFEVLDINSIAIEELDLQISKSAHPQLLKSIEVQKRKLMELKRIVLPMKEIAIALESSKSPLFKRDTKHYFSDLKQNCISIIEEIESNKNALEGLSNLYYASQSQRMNEIMKVLTIVSTIFIPLTFIAGIYGMNFQYMPELRMKNGYFITWGIMVFITLGLLGFFYKKGWLKKN